MRCIAAPAAATPSVPPSERAALDAVRHLSARFPAARLREVPLLRAWELDARADPNGKTRVWLALEALQVTGSFKVRGALASLDANRAHGHFVAPSAGNHGAGIAYAARVLGLSVTVCVPRGASQVNRARIEKYGAELVVAESGHYDDTEELAREIAAAQGAFFISPYDADVVRGNGSSLGFEIVRALGGVPERVLVPFGGGGLATGLSWALATEAQQRPERVVWGVQSEAACAMAASMENGRAVTRIREESPTLADALALGIAEEAFARAISVIAGIVVATEPQIAAAMAHAYREMGLVLEGSAAAALAPVLFGLPEPLRGGDLVVVMTGRNVDPGRLDAVLRGTAEPSSGW
jgi:threonine dehydratase